MRHLTVEGLIEFLEHHPRIRILDVRVARERQAWHIPGAHHVPWYTPEWEPDPGFLDQVRQHCSADDYLLVICSNGQRSCEAALLLEAAGFEHVYNVLGGFEDILKMRHADVLAGSLELLYQPRRT